MSSVTIQTSKKLKPSGYVALMIESLGDRRQRYQTTSYVDDSFRTLFITLWFLHTDVDVIDAKINTHPGVHPANDLQFIQKTTRQLALISLHTPALARQIDNAIIELGALGHNITRFNDNEHARRYAAMQAAAHGDESEEDEELY